jgi:hypothetical protein
VAAYVSQVSQPTVFLPLLKICRHLADISDVFAPDSASSYSKLHLPQQEEGAKERIISCVVNYWQGPRLQIILSEKIAAGTAISVEHEDMLLMGEVVANVQQSHLWRADIHVEHALTGLMNLMALRAKLLEEAPAQVPVEVSTTA